MKRTALIVLLGLFVLPIEAHEGHDKAFGESGVVATTQKLHVSAEGQTSIGLKSEPVRMQYAEKYLETTGTVQAADDRIHYVTSPVAGILKAIKVQQGDSVKQGQLLATIYSAEVAKVLTDLFDQRSSLQSEISKTKMQADREIQIQTKDTAHFALDLERERQLLTEGITARKNYLDSVHAYETAKVRLESIKAQRKQDLALLENRRQTITDATKRQLSIMGLPAAEIERAVRSSEVVAEVPINAPAAGTIFARSVTLGESIDTSKQLFSIVKLSPIWVTLDIHQDELNQVRLGEKVRIQPPIGGGLTGIISSIGTVVDEAERTVHVRVVCDNSSGLLKPEMFVTARVLTARTSVRVVLVPASALVQDGERYWVYVKYGDDFQPVLVKTGSRVEDAIEISDGLYEGDQIVVSGARQLRSQSLLASKIQEPKTESAHDHDQKESVNQNQNNYLFLVLGVAGGLLIGAVLTALTFRNVRPNENSKERGESGK